MGSVKKILLLSTGDVNGAYHYTVKLAEILIDMGHDVKMLVKNKTLKEDYIQQYIFPKKKESIIEKATWRIKYKVKPYKPLKILDGEYAFISTDESRITTNPEEIIRQIGFKPDYIFSGMTDRFMNSTDIRNLQKACGAKVYTLMVDMNHLTGGCHYAWDCDGYIKGCPQYCPALGNNPLAKHNFEIKYRNASEGAFQCIASSEWTAGQIRKSKIYKKQQYIPVFNSIINTGLLNSNNKDIAKRIFNLDSDTFYILAGAQAPGKRKGFEYLKNALNIFSEKMGSKPVEILMVSRAKSSVFDDININKRHLDFITDYRLLGLLYQATDVFVNSSIEDSGPMMVSEALASGTPVVGFDMGVVNNMVINGYNGYKAELKSAEDLAKGIEEIYSLSPEQYSEYSKNAVKQVEEFSSYEHVKSELMKIII